MSASRGDHARCPEGTLINNRYKVIRECGCGNFSKVFRAVDTLCPKKTVVAVKLLKREYATDAKFENDMLKHINAADKADNHKLLKMRDYFVWNRHPVFVFPLKGAAVRNRKLSVTKGHVSRDEFTRFAFEMVQALAYMHHDLRMIHTDLKPENILLDGDVDKGLGNGWTIVDFGSASFYKGPGRLDADLISTRPYRAPEVVLGNGWCYRADVWSMACILFEVFTGTRMFEVHDDGAHISHFHQRLGKMPECFTHKAKNSRKFFDMSGNMLGAHGARFGARSSVVGGSSSSSLIKPLSEVLATEPELLDLLSRMLEFDPAKRMTCRDALKHPFFEAITGNGRAAAAPTAVPKTNAAAPLAAAAAPVAAAPTTVAPRAAPKNVLQERTKSTSNSQALVSGMERLKLQNAQPAAAPSAAPSSSYALPSSSRTSVNSGRVYPSQLPAAGKATPRSYVSHRPW